MQYFQEDIKNSTNDDVMEFGKYFNQKISDMAKNWEARNYMKYLITTDIDECIKGRLKDALECNPDIQPSLEQAGSYVVRFGQYKNSDLSYIVSVKGGMNYLKYIRSWSQCDRTLSEAIDVIFADYNIQKSAR